MESDVPGTLYLENIKKSKQEFQTFQRCIKTKVSFVNGKFESAK